MPSLSSASPLQNANRAAPSTAPDTSESTRSRNPDLHYIGLSIPVGRLPVAQMRAIADIADRFGSGEVRLTVWQNLLIPNIPTEHLEAAQQALTAAGLNYKAGTVLSGTVACTGNQGCRFSASDTKTHAVALANRLDERFPDP